MTNSSLPFIQSQKANKIGFVFSVLPKIKPIWRERINLDENVYTFIDFCDKNECWRRNIAPDDRLLLSSIFTKHLNTCQRNSSFIIKSSKSETKSIFFLLLTHNIGMNPSDDSIARWNVKHHLYIVLFDAEGKRKGWNIFRRCVNSGYAYVWAL